MGTEQDKREKRNIKPVIGTVVAVLLGVIAAFSWRMVFWVFNNWANLKMDELLFTMQANLSGTNSQMIRNATFYIAPFMVLAAVLIGGIAYLLRKKDRVRKIFLAAVSVISLGAIIGALLFFAKRIGFWEYQKNQNTESTFIEDNYVNPDSVAVTFPEKKRNLIYIYVESMETSFADPANGGGKPENIIPDLTEIGLENEMFAGDEHILNGGYALYGATYTMGGLFDEMK